MHGEALRAGKPEAPVCTDCHGEHDIFPHDDPRSPVAPANVSARVCSPCHASLKLTDKYDVAADRSKSYADSYHGLAVRGGSLEAANCASCHGAHAILPSSDPTSTVHKGNLAATCGRCHPGANERFAVGAVHVVIARGKEPILYWIATLYIGMILVTVGGMLAHNLLDFTRKVRRKLEAHRRGAEPAEHPHELYVRMTLTERLQHGVLVASFTVLVITGFMLRYPEAWWVVSLRRLSDSVFDLRTIVHRIAAVVMVAASLFHIGYVSLTHRGRQLVRDLVPARQDLYDVGRMIGYNLGLARARPAFGRFGYVEKFEYWALVWGTIVMAVTGGILWFDNTFMGILTKLGSDVARTIHYYEAVLATLAIVVWHFYYVIFNPDVYPMSFAWLTGKITENEMAEEHPLELQAIRRARIEESDAETTGTRTPPPTR
jgi:cytochrome b subunit of formate dehydrogenase